MFIDAVLNLNGDLKITIVEFRIGNIRNIQKKDFTYTMHAAGFIT